MSPSARPFAVPRDLLESATRAEIAPAAVAEVGRSDGPLWQHAAGTLTYGRDAPAATLATIFDLASLTKVIATTTIAMRLVEAGRLDLAAPVRGFVPCWRDADRAAVIVEDLLTHASGLPAVVPLYERCAGREEFEAAICRSPLVYEPRTRSLYSDLGFLLLGFILHDVGGAPLDAQFSRIVADILAGGDEVLRYGPIATTGDDERLARTAPTQIDEWRGRLLRGEVDDRNGAALQGVAGHTGLFGTVRAVGRFARGILRGRVGLAGDGTELVQSGTVTRFVTRRPVPGSSRALGWDTMLPSSSCGPRMSVEAFGHTGFTGTSLWIDPAADLYAVLLTNRVHPRAGKAEAIRALRRAFHDAVMEELERPNGHPTT